MALLEVKDMHVSYGAIKAVRGISFVIEEGEIVTIIGANGAGKSTIMRTLMGLEKAEQGTVLFRGKDVTNAPSYIIVKSGMVLSPEGRHIFPGLSVQENLKLGAYTASQAVAKWGYESAFELFPILKERLDQAAGTLSGGEQQMLAIARALMVQPKLLLLDEPSLGLAPIVVQDMFKLFQRVNSQGTTILLVEQNARMSLQVSHRGYVLETGEIVLTDTGERLAQNERVRDAYAPHSKSCASAAATSSKTYRVYRCPTQEDRRASPPPRWARWAEILHWS